MKFLSAFIDWSLIAMSPLFAYVIWNTSDTSFLRFGAAMWLTYAVFYSLCQRFPDKHESTAP